MFGFGGIRLTSGLKDIQDELECIYDGDYEIIYLTKKTFKHREEGLNFDYKYAVVGVNMWEATEDEQFEEKPFYIEVHLIPSPTSLHESVYKSIEDCTQGYCCYQGIFQCGYSVRMLYDNELGFSESVIEETMIKIANLIKPLDGIRGFYLDRHINMIGSTGWDMIRNCISGISFITAALDRIKSMQGKENV